MTTENRATGACTATPEAGNPTTKQLQSTIQTMDGLAMEGLAHIGAIAYLTNVALKAKGNDPGVIMQAAMAMRIIAGLCDEYSDDISGTAEHVGCASSWRDHVYGGAA